MPSIDSSQIDPIRINSLANTNLGLIKSGKCALSSLICSNNGAAAAYVKLYDKASAPVLASDVPVLVIPIPASSVLPLPMGDLGPPFELGLAIAITNLVGDTDATAVAAAQVKVFGGVVAT